MTQYHKYLKSWTSERGITSFLGSDKPEFQRDWKDEKSAPARFGEEMGKEDINRAGEAFKKTKPTGQSALKVLTNPDLLKQIGAFTNPKKMNDKFILPTGRDKLYTWLYDTTPKKVREYLDSVARKAEGGATTAHAKNIYKGLINFLRDYSKKNKNATNDDVWSYILSQGVLDTRGWGYGGKYNGSDLDQYRETNDLQNQNILYNYLSDEFQKNYRPSRNTRDEGFA